ncbi:unnamed protein product [Mucor hiemalis]
MTVPRPTAVATAPFDYLLTSDNSTLDKYNKIKKRLKETIKVNESLSRDYTRARKKIKTLTFERNLLLDRLSQINGGQSSDELIDGITSASDSDSETSTISYKKPQPQNNTNRRVISSQQKMTTVASAPPKRSKINRINVKTRRVQPIERDESGNPKLPQQIGVLTVLSLGKIKTDRDTFHNERYIFPVGYTVRRTYPSMIDPHNNTIITSTILDGGDGPRFHVLAADQPNDPIVANSATGAWTVVVKKSNEIRHREHSNSASGPDYYGFKHPTIAKMIQDLPGANQLTNYVWQNFEEMEPRAAKGVMAAAEKKRDNLEQMGNANRRLLQLEGEDLDVPTSSTYYSNQPMVVDSEEEVDELDAE